MIMGKTIKKIKMYFVLIILFFFIIFLISHRHIYQPSELSYGVTFSKKQAIALGLDWQRVFREILLDLQVKKIRLSAYWDEVEPKPNYFEWSDLDWQIKEAANAEAGVILAIGMRLPRWPECHLPSWTNNIDIKERQKKQLQYMEKVIKRYQKEKNIIAWQVENEPFLSHFGKCPRLDKNFLDKEIELTRSLDSRPIVITDSGELSFWLSAAKRADIFGTTMYRDTYSKNLKRYIHYPIGPGFFRFKRNVVSIFAHPRKWLVIELQAEPWGPIPFQKLSKKERSKTMNIEKFKEIISFSRLTGFREFYLWGVEWWYWEKQVNKDPVMWNEAKKLFNKS